MGIYFKVKDATTGFGFTNLDKILTVPATTYEQGTHYLYVKLVLKKIKASLRHYL